MSSRFLFNGILKKSPSIFNSLLVILLCTSLARSGNVLISGENASDELFQEEDWTRKYVQVNLTAPYNLFGRGMFNRLYVNSIGALSFGSPLQIHDLQRVRQDVIIFAPLLQDSQQSIRNKSIGYRQIRDSGEIRQIQDLFRGALNDDDFTVNQSFVATFNFSYEKTSSTNISLNSFQIILASSGDKTYLRFGYESTEHVKNGNDYARAGIFAIKEGAMQCSHEINGSRTDAMMNLTTSSNVNKPGTYYWRVDLPLECTLFQSDCGEADGPPGDFYLRPAGTFVETITSQRWTFYKFYFCKPGRTQVGSLVSARRECRYDSDYYTYEWSTPSDSEKCSVRIRARSGNVLISGENASDELFQEEDWTRKYVQVNLTAPYNLFGRGMFNRLYVNSIGALSFGSPLQIHDLQRVRQDVIIFAPLLQDSQQSIRNKSIGYRQIRDSGEIRQIQDLFRGALNDDDFTVNQSFVATFNFSYEKTSSTNISLNSFQIILASSGDKTYLRFGYESTEHVKNGNDYARAGIFAIKEGAMQCSHEINGSRTDAMMNLTTSSNVNKPGTYYWRVDLPLECTLFQSDCGEADELPDDFNLCPAGTFVETITSQRWTFYKFYFCKPGRTQVGSLVSARRECRYDSDYYTYEWSTPSDSEKCSVRIRDYWADFFSSMGLG